MDILDEDGLTLAQIAGACALEEAWLVRHVEEGFIPATGGSPADWRFTVSALTRVRRMRHIERAFDADPALAALVADMLEEMDQLRAIARRARP